jgi:hypothetical protein
MSIQRIVGIVVLAIGIILIILGITASRTIGNHLTNFFTGHPNDSTLWYLVGGIVAAVVGLVLSVGRFGRR